MFYGFIISSLSMNLFQYTQSSHFILYQILQKAVKSHCILGRADDALTDRQQPEHKSHTLWTTTHIMCSFPAKVNILSDLQTTGGTVHS